MKFTEWQEYARKVDSIAKRIKEMQDARGWAIAAKHGIPRDGCCLHNASIDDDLSGWCVGNPARLKAAKKAKRILDNWEASRIADRITGRAFKTVKF